MAVVVAVVIVAVEEAVAEEATETSEVVRFQASVVAAIVKEEAVAAIVGAVEFVAIVAVAVVAAEEAPRCIFRMFLRLACRGFTS